MLARGQAVRKGVPEAAPSEGVDADELSIPQYVIDAASARERAAMVQKVQEARLQVTDIFTSRFRKAVIQSRLVLQPRLTAAVRRAHGGRGLGHCGSRL